MDNIKNKIIKIQIFSKMCVIMCSIGAIGSNTSLEKYCNMLGAWELHCDDPVPQFIMVQNKTLQTSHFLRLLQSLSKSTKM